MWNRDDHVKAPTCVNLSIKIYGYTKYIEIDTGDLAKILAR